MIWCCHWYAGSAAAAASAQGRTQQPTIVMRVKGRQRLATRAPEDSIQRLAVKSAGNKSIDYSRWHALTKARVGKQKWVTNNGATTIHQQEWHRQAAAGDERVWGQRDDKGVGQQKWVANNDTTTNHHREWHRWVAAGDKSIWGQRVDEGIEDCTMAGNDESCWRTTTQQPTNDCSGEGVWLLVTKPPEGSGR